MDKKDVLKAIMNVKKYAKNLKKNATMRQINIDQDSEIHSPSPFFSSSTTQIISNRYETSSSIPNGNLSSFRQQRQINQFFNESSIPKMKRNLRSTLQPSNNFYDRVSHYSEKDKSLNSELNKRPDKKQYLGLSTYKGKQGKQVQRDQKKQFIFESNLVKELQSQIQLLQEQLTLYKNAMLVIKRKYIQMECRVSQKVAVDHFVDVLKSQLQIQRAKNDRLTNIIQKQKGQIDSFMSKIATLSQKLSQIYSEQRAQLSKLWKQNSVLRKMLFLAQPSQEQLKIYCKNIDIKQDVEKQEQQPSQQYIIRQPAFKIQNFEKKYDSKKQIDVEAKLYQFNF